ncbi:unnamed protein product [Parnassius apollo]|uniref:(apollo) hypothetical protein n=1 Tax=Parnassius apollo TaxID=110799 RepID=A0A8S3WEL6_PARAO|nr:unnamed protein product [Parnassius apollo]
MGDIKVNCLLYADDAVLIAPSEAELQALVTCMKEECEIKGLRLNANKTKVLVFEKDEERTKCEIWVNQECLEQVNEIVYLRSAFSRDGRYYLDVDRRVAAGNKGNGALNALVKRQGMVKSARLAIHNAVLVPTLLYGSETWVCQKKHKSKLNVVEMRSIRKMCGVTLADRKRNEEIRNMAGLKDDLITKIDRGVLQWFGHVERRSEDRMVKKIYRAKVNIKRCRGRPRLTFEDHVSKLLEEGRVKSTRIPRRACMKLMNLKEAKEVCKDRDTWRSVLSG